MKITIDKYDFGNAFALADRKDNFSYEALDLLFEYFEQYEADTGTEIDLDVIAICCEFYEETADYIARNYSIDLNDADAESEDYEQQCRAIVCEYLADHTNLVGETATGFVYATF